MTTGLMPIAGSTNPVCMSPAPPPPEYVVNPAPPPPPIIKYSTGVEAERKVKFPLEVNLW
jgi:hypothetical protein